MQKAAYKTKQQDLLFSYLREMQGKHFTAEDVRAHFEEKKLTTSADFLRMKSQGFLSNIKNLLLDKNVKLSSVISELDNAKTDFESSEEEKTKSKNASFSDSEDDENEALFSVDMLLNSNKDNEVPAKGYYILTNPITGQFVSGKYLEYDGKKSENVKQRLAKSKGKVDEIDVIEKKIKDYENNNLQLSNQIAELTKQWKEMSMGTESTMEILTTNGNKTEKRNSTRLSINNNNNKNNKKGGSTLKSVY